MKTTLKFIWFYIKYPWKITQITYYNPNADEFVMRPHIFSSRKYRSKGVNSLDKFM